LLDIYYKILISLLFSGFFSGLEIAFVSRNKLNFELKAKKGGIIGNIFSIFKKNTSHFFATMLLGNNLALVLYGIFMAELLEPIIFNILPEIIKNDILVLLFLIIISTLIVLITAEFIPKSLFLVSPNLMLSYFSVPLFIIYILLYPAVWVILSISKFFILNVLNLKYSEEKPVFSLTDLNDYVKRTLRSDSNNSKTEINTDYFSNALEFKTVKVRDCMIPRTELVCLDVSETIDNLNKLFVDSGLSKIIIYDKSINNVIGYCHGLSLYSSPKKIKEIIKPIIHITEATLASELLIQFISNHMSIAIVVDEYGETSGIITLEDIIEEIFGEIIDEYDDYNLLEQIKSDDIYDLSARHEIDYLNEKYNLSIPVGDYDTLGGYVLFLNKNLPKKFQKIQSKNHELKILSMYGNKIGNVRVVKK
tara:strand:+ start:564 stop:1826 length:1263 start_codon:yes stop_codon:yes gene_type:complete